MFRIKLLAVSFNSTYDRLTVMPRGVLPYQEVGGGGGLDLTSSLVAKFGARFSQVHQIKGKVWEVLLPQNAKVGKESQFWWHLGLDLKFKGQNLGLRHEFQRQIMGPRPLPPIS